MTQQVVSFDKTQWKACKLGDVASFKTGKLNSNAATENGAYPFFTCSPLTSKINYYAFDEEALLLAGNNANGIFSLKYYNGKFNAYQRTYIISTNQSYKFLFYTLKLKLADLVHISQGTATKFLTLPILNNIEFLLPPLSEQKEIAEILSSLDDKIDLLHRQNKTLESMAQTVFRQWFIEEANEEWEETYLPEEFDFIMGQSPSGDTFNEEKQGIPMFQGNADFGFRFPEERVYTTDPKRFAQPMDTLISVRAPVGAQNMALVHCCIGRGVATFRYKQNPSFTSYTYYKMHSLMEQITQFNDEGTVFGSISKSDFEKIKVVIPDFPLVEKFNDEVQEIDKRILLNTKQIKHLEKMRDDLLVRLMGGDRVL